MFLSFVTLSLVLQITTALHHEAKEVPVSDRISLLKYQLQEQLRNKFLDKGGNIDYLEVLDIENPKVINANADYLENSELPITPIMNSDEERKQHHAQLLPKLVTAKTKHRRTTKAIKTTTKRERPTTTTTIATKRKKRKTTTTPTTTYTYTTTTLALRFHTVTFTTIPTVPSTRDGTTITKATILVPVMATNVETLFATHPDTTTTAGPIFANLFASTVDDDVAQPIPIRDQVTAMTNEWVPDDEPYSEEEKPAETPQPLTTPSFQVTLPTTSPIRQPLRIFYSIFSKYRRLTEERTRNLPLRWVHCQDIITPILTGRVKEDGPQVALVRARSAVAQRLVYLFSLNTTTLSNHEKLSIIGQVNELQIRLFQWESRAIRLLLNVICKNRIHTFRALKRGLVDLFASWNMKTMNITNLLVASRIIRPPCTNVQGFDGSTKSSKVTTYTTLDQETTTSSKCSDNDTVSGKEGEV